MPAAYYSWRSGIFKIQKSIIIPRKSRLVYLPFAGNLSLFRGVFGKGEFIYSPCIVTKSSRRTFALKRFVSIIWCYASLSGSCKCVKAKIMHWLINSFLLMSAFAALSSTAFNSSDGNRMEITSLFGRCGTKLFILNPHPLTVLYSICYNLSVFII